MKPLELEKDLEKGNIAPLYLFYGEDAFLIDRTVDQLKKLLVDPRAASFNFSLYYGGESEPRQVINTAQTLPLAGKRRLVVVREADQFKSSWKDFAAYCEHPLPSTCLVFCSGASTLKADITSLFKKNGAAVRFYHPFSSEMPEWIRRMAGERNKKMSRDAAALLGEYLENDLQRISNELEKIALYAGERNVIEREHVEAVIAAAKEVSVFSLTDCLAGKDRVQALGILQHLLGVGESPLKILAMIARHYRLMARAGEMVHNGIAATEAGKQLGINNFHLKGFARQAETFDSRRTRDYFSVLFQSERKLKSSRISEKVILEDAVARLCAL
jgi:DNA polymerase III subunit delta